MVNDVSNSEQYRKLGATRRDTGTQICKILSDTHRRKLPFRGDVVLPQYFHKMDESLFIVYPFHVINSILSSISRFLMQNDINKILYYVIPQKSIKKFL